MPQAWEAGEVGVVAVQLGLMLDRERSQVHVGGQTGGHARRFEQSGDDVEVTRSGLENAHVLSLEPTAHALERSSRG
jgi:hypothetical protein